MASILDRFGIKEVADVTFYKINDDGSRGNPVLYLDTLKVSTIEQTAENVDAKGGKGNPALISWDYGKEINVTLEDALFSPKSMALMLGNGTVEATGAGVPTTMDRTMIFTCKTAATGYDVTQPIVINKKKYTLAAGDIKYFDAATGTEVLLANLEADTKYLMQYTIPVETGSAGVITVTADSFPGTYYIVGDTYARSQATGNDEFFQFVIQKAKVTAENTITLEAEGDPSVFNLNLKVLRPDDGAMMKLIKYNLAGGVENRGFGEEGFSEIF